MVSELTDHNKLANPSLLGVLKTIVSSLSCFGLGIVNCLLKLLSHVIWWSTAFSKSVCSQLVYCQALRMVEHHR